MIPTTQYSAHIFLLITLIYTTIHTTTHTTIHTTANKTAPPPFLTTILQWIDHPQSCFSPPPIFSPPPSDRHSQIHTTANISWHVYLMWIKRFFKTIATIQFCHPGNSCWRRQHDGSSADGKHGNAFLSRDYSLLDVHILPMNSKPLGERRSFLESRHSSNGSRRWRSYELL